MFGGWWVIETNRGAARASTTMIRITISAAMATLSRRSRRQVSCHWLRPWIFAALASSAAFTRCGFLPRDLNPGDAHVRSLLPAAARFSPAWTGKWQAVRWVAASPALASS